MTLALINFFQRGGPENSALRAQIYQILIFWPLPLEKSCIRLSILNLLETMKPGLFFLLFPKNCVLGGPYKGDGLHQEGPLCSTRLYRLGSRFGWRQEVLFVSWPAVAALRYHGRRQFLFSSRLLFSIKFCFLFWFGWGLMRPSLNILFYIYKKKYILV